MLKSTSETEKRKWTSKNGEDWSGAFGNDPRAYTNKKRDKIAEPGADAPPHDPINPSDDDDEVDGVDDDSDDSDVDLGITDHSNVPEGGFNTHGTSGRHEHDRKSMDTTHTNGTAYTHETYDTNASTASVLSPTTQDDKYMEKTEARNDRRKGRGMMQWKPARNYAFGKDEAKFGLNKLKKKLTGGLSGREPGVETEL